MIRGGGAARNRIAAILLAGGSSSRMGQDKALLDTPDGPVWTVVARALANVADPIVISTRTGSPLADVDGPWAVELDAEPDAGPLAALDSALARLEALASQGSPQTKLETELATVLVCAVDVVLVDPSTLELLVQRLQHSRAEACVVEVPGVGLAAQLFVAQGGPLRRAVDGARRQGPRAGLRSALQGLDLLRLAPEDLPEPDMLSPCNTPQEWARLRRRLVARLSPG